MGSEENGDRAYQQKIGSSMMATSSISDQFYSTGWDQSVNLGNSGMVLQNEFGTNSHYSSLIPKLPSFGSGGLSEMVNSFGIPRDDSSPGNRQSSGDGLLGSVKRKRNSSKNVEVEQHQDPSGNTSEFIKGDDENKKQSVKRGKESNSNDTEPAKDYIHVRAKRGQATNSHSLAERVRREKISERMKLLQDLVPGCDKITGKAVMLDEIINYVQSLQQQVEFLSMKLATVNPELNVDMDQILSKDILHSRGSNATALGLGSGLSSSHPFPALFQGPLNGIPVSTTQLNSLPQNSWNSELQSILQMGYDPNSTISRLGPHGL